MVYYSDHSNIPEYEPLSCISENVVHHTAVRWSIMSQQVKVCIMFWYFNEFARSTRWHHINCTFKEMVVALLTQAIVNCWEIQHHCRCLAKSTKNMLLKLQVAIYLLSKARVYQKIEAISLYSTAFICFYIFFHMFLKKNKMTIANRNAGTNIDFLRTWTQHCPVI